MGEKSLLGDVRALREQIANLIGPHESAAEDPQGGVATATMEQPLPAACGGPSCPSASSDNFAPHAPATLPELGFGENDIVALVLKTLLQSGVASGNEIAEHMKVPLRLLSGLFRQLKEECLVVYKGSVRECDYMYELTDAGRGRAQRYSAQCTYWGAMPVSLDDYVASVKAQSVRGQKLTLADIRRAFNDLLVSDTMLTKLGQATRSGLALFLYGAPGNGKTSIAERITRAFGPSIWIPRAIGIDKDIIRVFDPTRHEELPLPNAQGPWIENPIDQRWIRIRRPTIVVGGELIMENLEVTVNTAIGVSEAPVQLKSNCGTLVVDDFGRQRIAPVDLLNRWIVPLEKRYDVLNLGSGRRIDVPFDQLIVFATNLEPRQLVDEAFLRRIPYKIDVKDPTEAEFRELLHRSAQALDMACDDESIGYLIEKHYIQTNRPMRCCHPRDLVHQMHTYCSFLDHPLAVAPEAIDAAVENYFATV